MQTRWLPWITFAALALACAGEIAYYLPVLPARVAVHFDIHGNPNGWASHAGIIRNAAIPFAIMAVIFVSASLVSRLPIGSINLPNKAYWFAPGRAEGSFSFLRDWIRWVVVLVAAFLTAIMGLLLRPTFVPTHVVVFEFGVGGFVLAIVAMIIALLARFRLPRE
jgi:uncharacterized membrane protein